MRVSIFALLAERDSKARKADMLEAREQLVAAFAHQLLKFLVPYKTCLPMADAGAPEEHIMRFTKPRADHVAMRVSFLVLARYMQ